MKNTFKPWLHPIEPEKRTVLHLVTGVARELSVPIMLLGAFARELHFYHQYGIPCARRTRDIDFSIQVPDWEAYEAFRARLKKQGFLQRESRHPEKLMHPETGQEIDLLPFGEISNEAEQIIWPTDNSPWSVVGFEEAFQTSLTCEIQDLHVAVVALPMLVALKIVAIMDRELERYKKDSSDIAFILVNYLQAGNRDRLLSGPDADLMDACQGDLDAATARLLGRDMGRMMKPETYLKLSGYLTDQVSGQSRMNLIRGMKEFSAHPTYPLARNRVKDVLLGMQSGKH